MKIIIAALCVSCIFVICGFVTNETHSHILDVDNQIRQIAIEDFSKTKLYNTDSVFYISLYHTFHRMSLKWIDKKNAEWVSGKDYPNILALKISGYRNRFLLDTTVSISDQKGMPSRFIEKNGKLFFWYDDHKQLTDSTIQMLEKYNRLYRGTSNDPRQFHFVSDELHKATHYYFCKRNLSVFKKVTTNVAIGYYDPPKIECR